MKKEDKIDKLIEITNSMKIDIAVLRTESTNHVKHHEQATILCLERHNNIDQSLSNMREIEKDSTREIKSDLKETGKNWIEYAYKIAPIIISLIAIGIALYLR